MRGFTLIELLVVIAIVTTISLGGYESIISFQRQSQVEATSGELLATLRDAQSRSRSGQLLTGEAANTFTDDGLPVYGVLRNDSLCDINKSPKCFFLIRQYTPSSGPPVSTERLEEHPLDTTLSVTPSSFTVMFSRITGSPDTKPPITVQKGTSTTMRTITICTNGLIASQPIICN